MANEMIRYIPTELTDHQGNVRYPHTDASVTFMGDGRRVQNVLERLDTLLDTIETITSSSEINEDTALVTAAALAEVKNLYTELSSDLGGFHPIIDPESGQITAYKTKVGADTVFPFSDVGKLSFKSFSGTSTGIFSVNIPEGTKWAYVIGVENSRSREPTITVTNNSAHIQSVETLYSTKMEESGYYMSRLTIYKISLRGNAFTLNITFSGGTGGKTAAGILYM